MREMFFQIADELCRHYYRQRQSLTSRPNGHEHSNLNRLVNRRSMARSRPRVPFSIRNPHRNQFPCTTSPNCMSCLFAIRELMNAPLCVRFVPLRVALVLPGAGPSMPLRRVRSSGAVGSQKTSLQSLGRVASANSLPSSCACRAYACICVCA